MSTPDLTEFHELAKPRRKTCPVALALEDLTKAERAQFEAACATDTISNQALHLWLERHADWHSTWQSALSHRDRKCSCANG